MNRKKIGIPVVLSAPSGGGKSTIAAALLKRLKSVVRSISCTTRAPRLGEKNGVHYIFTNESEFQKRIKQKDFLEWARVHENYYGTPRASFEKEINKGKDVLLVIDPQGAASLRKIYPQGIYIFVVPPTWDILVKRLKGRASDHNSDLKIRLKNARGELKALNFYDYLVVNDDLAQAVEKVVSVLRAEHCRLSRIKKNDLPILKSVTSNSRG